MVRNCRRAQCEPYLRHPPHTKGPRPADVLLTPVHDLPPAPAPPLPTPNRADSPIPPPAAQPVLSPVHDLDGDGGAPSQPQQPGAAPADPPLAAALGFVGGASGEQGEGGTGLCAEGAERGDKEDEEDDGGSGMDVDGELAVGGDNQKKAKRAGTGQGKRVLRRVKLLNTAEYQMNPAKRRATFDTMTATIIAKAQELALKTDACIVLQIGSGEMPVVEGKHFHHFYSDSLRDGSKKTSPVVAYLEPTSYIAVTQSLHDIFGGVIRAEQLALVSLNIKRNTKAEKEATEARALAAASQKREEEAWAEVAQKDAQTKLAKEGEAREKKKRAKAVTLMERTLRGLGRNDAQIAEVIAQMELDAEDDDKE